jgi:hypothetical protein
MWDSGTDEVLEEARDGRPFRLGATPLTGLALA